MKAFIYWSSGKDAAMALHLFYRQYGFFPALLLCQLTTTQQVAAHEISHLFIKQQAKALNIPVHFVYLPAFSGNTDYEATILPVINSLKQQGFTHAIAGDIFLEDIKNYRLHLHQKAGIECIFPLWNKPTGQLGRDILQAGIKAVVTSVNTAVLNESLAGALYNEEFLGALPAKVDPCGENGEFHTLVYDAPFFHTPVFFQKGEISGKTLSKGTPYEMQLAVAQLIPAEDT